MKKILFPLPTFGFDPSEVAIPWKLFTENNLEVVFTTPNGDKATTDNIMLTGKSLGLLKGVLAARKDAVTAHNEMIESKEFCSPKKYADIYEKDFDAIFLPGGHDKSVKEYLESKTLQNLVVQFFESNKNVGAICHGCIVAARSINPKTKKSVLYNYKMTALLKKQELLGYNLTKLWLKDYYLTYPITVEDEVKSVLADENQFILGPNPMFRDSQKNLKAGFFVRDKNYLSARWPGDVYNISLEFIKMMNEK